MMRVRTAPAILVLLGCLFFLVFGYIYLFRPAANSIVIGAVPYKNTADQIQKFEPIGKYLEKEMGTKVKIVGEKDYLGLVDDMKRKKVDIGFYGPFSYIAAEKEMELDPLVMEYRKETGATYYSLIVSRKKSGIKDIGDLKGKRFAFVDPGSTSGYVIPFAMFTSRDIDTLHYFSSVTFSGTHDNVAIDVLNGKVDAGSMDDIVFNQMIEAGKIKKDDFNIIWKSAAIPGSPYVARSGLDKKLKDGFKKAMLEINVKSPEALEVYDKNVEKFTGCDRSSYTDIRNIARILGEDFIIDNFLKGK